MFCVLGMERAHGKGTSKFRNAETHIKSYQKSNTLLTLITGVTYTLSIKKFFFYVFCFLLKFLFFISV